MRPVIRYLIPFAIGLAIPGGLWAYTAYQGRGERAALEDELSSCRKDTSAAKDAAGAAGKGGAWFCALPTDTTPSACFTNRQDCEAQATACREQSFAVCAGGRCFSDVWGCVKQATAGQGCESRP